MTIQYPVDVDNTRWTIYSTATEEILQQNRKWPVADGGPIEGLDPNWVYLLEVHEDVPDHDPRVEVLAPHVIIDLSGSLCTYTWTVQPSVEDPVEYLAHCKRIVRADITQQRNEVEGGGFTYDGHRYDSDRDSAIRISNAAIQAQANMATFSIDWTTEDNQSVTLDGPGMMAMQGAMIVKADASHQNARVHKDAVDALTTAQEVLEYDYSGGWPA